MSVTFTGVGVQPMPITYVGMYSDGTPMVKTDQYDNIRKNADTMVLQASSLQEFVVAMFLYDALREGGRPRMKLVMPYIPGARQDRSNPTGDVLFTLRSVARMLNERNFSSVVVADPHSPKSVELIDNLVEFPLERIYDKLWRGYTGVIAPDKGAVERATRAAAVLDKPLFLGGKTRDVATGRLTGFTVEELPKGGHFVIVDDICDGGGTFIGLGEKIREQGCFADLYVTHGIFSKGTRGLREIFKNIYTTDTRKVEQSRRTRTLTLPIVAEMENYND